MEKASHDCILYGTGECNENCDDCNRCDINPRKTCDNCMKCISGDADYRSILIEGIRLSPEN